MHTCTFQGTTLGLLWTLSLHHPFRHTPRIPPREKMNGLALIFSVVTTRRFLEASNYCLGYYDSYDGGYDPS